MEASFAVVSVIVRYGTVASVLYLGFRSGTVAPGVLGCNIPLDTLIWRIRPWCLVAVDWGHSVWMVLMDVGILGLIYRGVGSRTVNPGVSGRNILLTTLIWRTGTWFLVDVDWSHSVWVVVMYVGILMLILVRVG